MVRKYRISARLKNENPKKRLNIPPQLAKKSVTPYNSDLLDIVKSASLKNNFIWDSWRLKL
jgi:hypothetical protein